MIVDSGAPCIVGVAAKTWHAEDVGAAGAPEPMAMWAEVVRTAASDSGADVLSRVDSLDIVYCQTTQYDDACGRLADALGIDPARRAYSGIGGTTGQVLVNGVATSMAAGELDVAVIVGAEALATKRRLKKAGEQPTYSYRPAEKPEFPWEAPFLPTEIAHEVFQAWLTFALFDNARRAHFGVALDDYRRQIGELWAPCTEIAAANPHAWFRNVATAEELITPTPDNRMVGYPYTKRTVSIMDVDMAAALVVTTHAAADGLGVPPEKRVYLRGGAYAADPVYVAEHTELWQSPAMGIAADATGVGIDEVAHLDLYSCFASSLFFACDALGINPSDQRALTVTGGLPYHGGPGSNYLTHSIAAMVETLRHDPGSLGLVSGVGMHMTKHVYGAYSTEPGPVTPPRTVDVPVTPKTIVATHEGAATVAAYSVVHDRDGAPEWGLAVCDIDSTTRCYARILDADVLAEAERTELVGRHMTLSPDGPVNVMRQ